MRNARAGAHSGTAAEIQPSSEQWRQELTPQQYVVLRCGDTKRPFTGEYVHSNEKGPYCCAACRSELFRSDAKFDSGTG
jgi:peptide-methionine (R)-S-oxide reductase